MHSKTNLLYFLTKPRFIVDTLSGNIDLRNKKRDEIHSILTDLNFDADPNSPQTPYNYLVKMPMDSVSKEAVDKLLQDKTTKQDETDKLSAMKIQDIWLTELAELKKEYIKVCDLRVEKKGITIKKKK